MAKQLKNDRILFVAVIAMVFFGLVMVFSASAVIAERAHGHSYYFLVRQGAAALAGLAGMIWLMHRDYQRFRHPAVVFGLLALVMAGLVAVLFVDRTANTHRFFRVGPLSIQPSEFAKPALILFLAWFLERRARAIEDPRTLGPVAVLLTALAALVFAGRDLGTAVALVIIGGVILWTAGLHWKYFAAGAAVLVPAVLAAVVFVRYRLDRILIFLDPWKDPQGKGFQIIQSMIAVGTGGFTGLGLMESKQKLYYLPAPHTDFIYAVISEELGLIGAALVLLAFCVILWRGARAALAASDRFGLYLAVGFTAMLVSQALINMSVVLDLAPTKGMPLPLVSYGGSSLVCAMWGCGMLLSVSQRSG
ncbi:MAG TPA: putative lipid II flippase FtsW [Bryobacterales bacterium]|nr:putative lipid II flippase FtsW [Bryobacterales bacterium]